MKIYGQEVRDHYTGATREEGTAIWKQFERIEFRHVLVARWNALLCRQLLMRPQFSEQGQQAGVDLVDRHADPLLPDQQTGLPPGVLASSAPRSFRILANLTPQ